MSRLSQFSGGNITSGFIDVEVFIVSGGGGGGSNGPGGSPQGLYAGCGGGGAVYYGVISIAPGTQCTVIVGGGGAGNQNHNTTSGTFHGYAGGYSAFLTPTTNYRVAGGGGGGGSFAIGTRGGCSGGDHGSRPLYDPRFSGVPSQSGSSAEANMGGSFYGWGSSSGDYVNGSPGSLGGGLPVKGGIISGKGGGGKWPQSTSYNNMGGGGAGGGPQGYYGGFGVYTHLEGYSVNSIRGKVYGEGGSCFPRKNGEANTGQGGSASTLPRFNPGYNGGSGVVLINYPNRFGNATVTGSGNGAISFSPGYGVPSTTFTNGTYGVRGYKFINSGTITLP